MRVTDVIQYMYMYQWILTYLNPFWAEGCSDEWKIQITKEMNNNIYDDNAILYMYIATARLLHVMLQIKEDTFIK